MQQPESTYINPLFDRRQRRPFAGLLRFGVMAIALIVTGDAIGRLFFNALGQVPGTMDWYYGLWFYVLLSGSAVVAIVAPKVGKPGGLITIGLMSIRTMTTYCAAFAHGTIGLMALSVGHWWGAALLLAGIIYLVGACNLLLRLVR